ncbi:MAG: shikimate dehydrogenase [Pseudomonadota bacterium]|nr:shikimate dehydrogenase [Pseudomonadota bacterium]
MTDAYAVFGNPIGHSKSPQIHAAFARACQQDMRYGAIEAPLGGFAEALRAFVQSGGRGANVTAPFKLDAYAAAHSLSERARAAGAVNALKFEDGRILGENFDGVGLVRDIEVNLGAPVAGRRVLLLGAGGAARGAAPAILGLGPAMLTIANRDAAKSAALVAAFAALGPVEAAPYADLSELPPYDIVLNSTSASWSGERPPMPSESFGPRALAYELVYGKGLTPFLAQARAAGVARLADGVGMLVEQAAEAFRWWRGVRPETAAAIAELTVPLI